MPWNSMERHGRYVISMEFPWNSMEISETNITGLTKVWWCDKTAYGCVHLKDPLEFFKKRMRLSPGNQASLTPASIQFK